tara:strand:+ start:1991 stop:2686 length:696 start_codon:yes stop_codon:yes gene_type:complete
MTIVIFILVFTIAISLYFSCYKVNIIEFSSNKPGKNILLVAGTHGNEPAGVYALNRLINYLKNDPSLVKSGKITIINNMNKCGYYIDTRNYSNVGKKLDLNRLYGKNFVVNKQVENIIDRQDIILDFHEGWGYIKKDKSIGSSITFSNDISDNTKKDILDTINSDITTDYKKFIESKKDIIPYSLRDYAKIKNKTYILLETTGQNNVQPLNLRVNQSLLYTLFFLRHYKVM